MPNLKLMHFDAIELENVFENGEIANKTIGACTKDEILELLK